MIMNYVKKTMNFDMNYDGLFDDMTMIIDMNYVELFNDMTMIDKCYKLILYWQQSQLYL